MNNSIHCLQFAYFMYGDNVGDLNVYINPKADNSVPPVPNYKISGSKGNQWNFEKITMNFNETLGFNVILKK